MDGDLSCKGDQGYCLKFVIIALKCITLGYALPLVLCHKTNQDHGFVSLKYAQKYPDQCRSRDWDIGKETSFDNIYVDCRICAITGN